MNKACAVLALFVVLSVPGCLFDSEAEQQEKAPEVGAAVAGALTAAAPIINIAAPGAGNVVALLAGPIGAVVGGLLMLSAFRKKGSGDVPVAEGTVPSDKEPANHG